MNSSAPSPARVREVVDTLGPPGTPLTTSEVAAEFDCTDRTIYNRLEALVKDGSLETKKVGARGRVWWRPVDGAVRQNGAESELRERNRESEAKYRSLLESINEGFCLIEVLFDEDGKQEDYRFLETNPAFEEITGLSDVDGKRRRNLEDDFDPQFFNICGEVAQTGEPRRFEASGQPLIEGWYDVSVVPYGEEDSGRVALLVDDITERKRLERELRTEKDQLNVAVENSPLTLFRLDTDLRYTWIRNPNGFEPESILGKRDDELLPPESAETVMAPKRRALETGQRVREEVTYALPNGQVTYDLTVSPTRDDSGETTSLVCAAHDITERKEAEQDLRETNERLEVALNAAGMGTWEWNLDARTVSGDNTFMSLFDLPLADEPVPVERFYEVGSERGIARSEETMNISFKPGEEIQKELPLAGDPPRWISWRGRATEEDPSVLHGVSFDITKRKQRERQLEEYRRQYQTLIDNFPSGAVALVDQDLRYVVYGGITADSDATRADYEGNPVQEVLPQDHADVVIPGYKAALDGETVAFEETIGEMVYRLHFVPVRDDEDEVFAVTGMAHDITERKEAEQQLTTELEAMKRLQEVSTQSVQQDDGDMLYDSALETVIDLLDADFGTIQRLDSQAYELEMFAYRGFSAETIALWDRVDVDTSSSCGRALQTKERVVVPDVETCEFIEAGPDLEAFTRVGIRSMQSTPLISRSGELLGMISTHWTDSHEPSERDRHLLDVLARQVADLMEQRSMIEDLRTSEERLTAATNAAEIGVWELDLRTGEELYTSPRYAEILGYDELPDDWSLEHALELYHPDDRERLETYLEDGLGEWTFESRITRTDGEERWISVESTAYEDDDGTPVRAVGTMLDITERKKREKELRESEERYRTLFESINEGFCIIEMLFDEDDEPVDYRFLETNPAFEEHTGLTDAEGERIRDLEPDLEDHWFETYGHVARTGEPERFQAQAEQLGGRWYNLHAFRIGDPEERKVAVVFSDISDIKYPQEALERLTDASRELIEADTETLQDRVAELAVNVFDADSAALWQYDEASGELTETTGALAARIDATKVYHPDAVSEHVWQTFVGDEIAVTNDLSVDETIPDGATLRSRLLIPLGRHGVVCVGSRRSNVFEEWVIDLAETFGATLETAWDRAESEHRLQEQNQELQRLDRLNALIRSIDQALVGADTREGIDEAVCEQLAGSELYESAWLATYDAETDTLRPQAWAGIDSRYLDDWTITVEDASSDDPLVAAHRTQEMQIVSDIAVDARAASWREAALERGVRSCIKIPLVYEESIYGILTVYGRTPQPDDREIDVLTEFGQTIAHAINAIESTTTRQTDSVVELTLRTKEANTPLAHLARDTNCSIAVEALIPNTTGDEFTVFFKATGISPDDLLTAGEQVLAIEDLSCLEAYEEDEEGGLFRTRLTESQLVSVLLTREAVARSITIEAGTVTVVVDLSESTAVSEFVDELRQHLPDVELLARMTRSRPLETQYSLRASVEDRLTARQREVLRVAYESGFFESPRVQTGKQLADTLDVSQSTFTYHLRESQRRLCGMVFDHA